MTTKASARQAMPPSRNASGVEPPLVAATPETLSSIAMPGASTDTEIAMASGSRSEPRASASAGATAAEELISAMKAFLSLLGHQDGLVVQDVVEGERHAVALVQPRQEGLVHWMVAVGGHGVEVGEFGVEQVRVPAGAGPGDVGAKPDLGHQADLPRPGRHHGAQLGLVLGT